MIRISNLKLQLDYKEQDIVKEAAKKLRCRAADIKSVSLVKRSLDARKKPQLFYVAVVDAAVSGEKEILKKNRDRDVSLTEMIRYGIPSCDRKNDCRTVITGSGPAGLFCGLILARAGLCPLILERGCDVDKRTADVEHFWNTGKLDTESNIQFGEGGAGTFSDGKLNTAVKDSAGRNQFVLETFVRHGADPDILYVNKPHIGTDVLRGVVKNIREEIISLGGEVRFLSKMTDIIIRDGRVQAVEVNGKEIISCSELVLAIGHSARDTFALLEQKRVIMQPKSFAVGLRMEHPQSMINYSRYGCEDHPLLPAADYKVTRKLQSGRGVYSFCMCPGGCVVNASSEENRIAVNGMSYRARDGRNANSAMIVTVTPEDFGHPGILGGVEFQRDLESRAFLAGEGRVPAQLFGDFRENRRSSSLGDVLPDIRGGYTLCNLREALPEFISGSLIEGILGLESQIEGFSRYDAVFSGVESRTSSPVKIPRNELLQSNIAGLYPCGEGAGYAGGITSAAMDGMKCAEAVLSKYIKF